MIWCCFLVFAASLPTALASPFPQDSVNLFDPDLETQPGFSTAFPVDESISWNTDLSPEAGDNSNLFSLLPDPTTADGAADQFLASSDLEGSALTSDSSSCGTQDSSGALPTDAQVALDMLNSNSLDARGFFDDVDKLQNEVIDPPSDPSCAAPNSVKSPGEKFPRPNVYRKIGLDVTPLIEDETKTIYPVDEFGKCPVLEPDYTEALCCTGQQYGIYVLRCAPASISFFCGYEGNQYCCKRYHPPDLIGVDCIRVRWPGDGARPFTQDSPLDGMPPYPNVQDGVRRTRVNGERKI